MDPVKSLRDHGVRIGTLEPGPANSIADVSEFAGPGSSVPMRTP